MPESYPIVLAVSALSTLVLFVVITIKFAVDITNVLSLFAFAIFMLGLAIGIIYIDFFLPGRSNTSNPLLEFIIQGKDIIIISCILAFFIITIRTLLVLYKQNTPDKPTNKVYYEGFENFQILKLTQKAQTLLESFESALDDLTQIETETCTVVGESKQMYVNANTSSGSENDAYNACLVREGEKGEELCNDTKPSPERKKELETRRRDRAQQKYQMEFSQFQTRSRKSAPLLECFSDLSEDEDDLREALQDLKPYAEESFQKKIRERCDKIQISMDYVVYLTQKGQSAMENTKIPEKEGFANPTLLQEAEQSIQSVQILLTLIQKTKDIFESGKKKYEELNGKVSRAVSGTPQQSDLISVVSPTPEQGECPRFMFSYGKDPKTGADGFCCPFEPTGYDTISGQYQECGTQTKEADKHANKRRNAATQNCNDNDICIRSTVRAFNSTKQHRKGCSSGKNPLESDMKPCTYICKDGEICPYSSFRVEKP